MNDQPAPTSDSDPSQRLSNQEELPADLELTSACPEWIELLVRAEGDRAKLHWSPPAEREALPRQAPRAVPRRTAGQALLLRTAASLAAGILVVAGVSTMTQLADSTPTMQSPSATLARETLAPGHRLEPGDAAAPARSHSLATQSKQSSAENTLLWDDPTEQRLQAAYWSLLFVTNREPEPDEWRLQAAASALEFLQRDVSQSGL